MASPVLVRAPLVLGLTCLLMAGCRKEQISTFSAPKESPSRGSSASAKVSAPPPQGAAPSIQWTTPAGWEEQPASGMRVGSFAVNKDGKHADVSIIPLAGISGGDLANVNRWRGQVGLPPIEAGKLEETAEKASIGSTPSAVYDLAGTDPQTKQPTRIVASILSNDGTTWFFKMIGSEDLVEKQKPAFKEFLKSIDFQASPAAAQANQQPPPEAAPLMSAAASTPGVAALGAPSEEKPAWDLPAGWKEQAPTSMRVATFAVTGENGAKADVSVVKLGGMAGGLLANVNRWRAQMGLEPVDQAGLDKLISSRDVKGTKITVVDMAGRSVESGNPARLVAVIVPRSGVTWFYKMLGQDQLVSQQKAAFIQFVESARYPNVS
jgi:hypothetical protein